MDKLICIIMLLENPIHDRCYIQMYIATLSCTCAFIPPLKSINIDFGKGS